MFTNLRYDCNFVAQLMQTESFDVHGVDAYAARALLEQSKQAKSDRALACARATHNADLLAGHDPCAQIVDDVGQLVPIPDRVVDKVDLASLWPIVSRSCALNRPLFLLSCSLSNKKQHTSRLYIKVTLKKTLESATHCYLVRRVAVLFDSLNRDDVGLEVGAHAHYPVETLRHVERVGDGEAGETGADRVARQHGEKGRQHRDQVADELETQRQPPVGYEVGQVEDEVVVDVLLHGAHKATLGTVGAYRADAGQRLAEVREHRRLACRLEALELTHRGHKVALHEHVDDDQRRQRDEKQRR